RHANLATDAEGRDLTGPRARLSRKGSLRYKKRPPQRPAARAGGVRRWRIRRGAERQGPFERDRLFLAPYRPVSRRTRAAAALLGAVLLVAGASLAAAPSSAALGSGDCSSGQARPITDLVREADAGVDKGRYARAASLSA